MQSSASPHEEAKVNGGSVPALPPCPLDEHTKEHFRAVEERFQNLEMQVANLTLHRDRLENALREAGKFIFDSPMSKLMLASIPKDKQLKLKEFFANGNVGSATNKETR